MRLQLGTFRHLDVPDPGEGQFAGGALEILGGGPGSSRLGVRRAGDRVHDGRLGVSGLHVPGPLEPLDHLVRPEARHVDRPVADQGLEDRPDVVDAVEYGSHCTSAEKWRHLEPRG